MLEYTRKSTQAMTTTTVNDALVQLDNVITAANFLLEELQTRKTQLLGRENIRDNVQEQMQSSWFNYQITNYIRNEYGNVLSREVAFYVMERIDADIEAFINDRVNKALEQAQNQNQ